MKEKDVESYLVRRVRHLGGEYRKVAFVGHRGAPDRLVLLPGQVCWVELKVPNGRLAFHQIREHGKLRKYGQTVFVIWSKAHVDKIFPALRRVA